MKTRLTVRLIIGLLLIEVVWSTGCGEKGFRPKPETDMGERKGKLVENPLVAIHNALPRGWSISKVDRDAYPWHRLEGKGTAIYLVEEETKYIKQQFSAVLFIMPAGYKDDITIRPGVAQTGPPNLIATVNDAKIYLWSGQDKKFRKVILEAIIRKE